MSAMRSTDPVLQLCARIALCLAALAAGALAARFTNIARHDLTRMGESASYSSLRASVRYTGSPSSAARASRLLRAPKGLVSR